MMDMKMQQAWQWQRRNPALVMRVLTKNTILGTYIRTQLKGGSQILAGSRQCH
jgi:hypothetical protein